MFCSNPELDASVSIQDAGNKIRELKTRGYSGVAITGGEPTLHPMLSQIIRLSGDAGLSCRLITNGQRTANRAFLNKLVQNGLGLITVSVFSCRDDVHDMLANCTGSLNNALKTIENALKIGIAVNIATTINAFNACHLHETTHFLVERFPEVRHVTWNNLDPLENRTLENPQTIPKLWQFEVSLFRAVSFLSETKRTFRVERVPLCYMAEFAHCSTETRKICKKEERTVYFLDEKGAVQQQIFSYGKAQCCTVCALNEICAGLFAMNQGYDPAELSPVFQEIKPLKERIMNEE